MQLAYVIVFVDKMQAGVAFYRDTLGLPAACRANLEGQGVKFTREPAPVQGVLLAEFADPAGMRFSLSAPA
jgi:predicted enzyme related to lactoylglutathione lyase